MSSFWKSLAGGAFLLSSPSLTLAAETPAAPQNQWSVECSQDLCQVYADIRLKNGALFNSVLFRKLGANVYAGVLKLPLGLHIPSGIQIGIDDDALFDAKLITCKADGCEAAFTATPAIVNFLKRGKTMSIVVTKSSDRKKLALNYSLIGFTKNWSEFVKRMAVLLPDDPNQG